MWNRLKNYVPGSRGERLASDAQIADILGSGNVPFGVDPRIAQTFAALSRCITLISGTAAQVISGGGLRVVGPDGRAVERGPALVAKRLLTWSPDGGDTPASQFVEDVMTDLLLEGNSLIVPRRAGRRVVGLRRALPYAEVIGRPGAYAYRVRYPGTDGRTHTVSQRDVVHVKWPGAASADGHDLFGPSPVRTALRSALGIGLGGDRFVEEAFKQGLRSPLHIDVTTPSGEALTKEQIKGYRQTLAAWKDDGQPFVTVNAKVQALKISPQTQDTKELRMFQVREVARVYGIPLPLVGDEGTNWGGGLSALSRFYWRFGCVYHVNRLLMPLALRILPVGQRLVPDVTEMGRGDAQETATVVTTLGGDAQRHPVATHEELRRMAGLPDEPHGEFLPALAQEQSEQAQGEGEGEADDLDSSE